MPKQLNPEAFPWGNSNGGRTQKGMGLREYYAGQVISKCLTTSYYHLGTLQPINGVAHEKAAVESSFRIADLMIAYHQDNSSKEPT